VGEERKKGDKMAMWRERKRERETQTETGRQRWMYG
jgi:hypothetical protein